MSVIVIHHTPKHRHNLHFRIPPNSDARHLAYSPNEASVLGRPAGRIQRLILSAKLTFLRAGSVCESQQVNQPLRARNSDHQTPACPSASTTSAPVLDPLVANWQRQGIDTRFALRHPSRFMTVDIAISEIGFALRAGKRNSLGDRSRADSMTLKASFASRTRCSAQTWSAQAKVCRYHLQSRQTQRCSRCPVGRWADPQTQMAAGEGRTPPAANDYSPEIPRSARGAWPGF